MGTECAQAVQDRRGGNITRWLAWDGPGTTVRTKVASDSNGGRQYSGVTQVQSSFNGFQTPVREQCYNSGPGIGIGIGISSTIVHPSACLRRPLSPIFALQHLETTGAGTLPNIKRPRPPRNRTPTRLRTSDIRRFCLDFPFSKRRCVTFFLLHALTEAKWVSLYHTITFTPNIRLSPISRRSRRPPRGDRVP